MAIKLRFSPKGDIILFGAAVFLRQKAIVFFDKLLRNFDCKGKMIFLRNYAIKLFTFFRGVDIIYYTVH